METPSIHSKVVRWTFIDSRNFFLIILNILAAVFLPAGGALAQTYSALHAFSPVALPYNTNLDGANPVAGMIQSGATFYGTTVDGGSYSGTVFKINADGTGFTVLHNFTTNDGYNPEGGLVLSGATLYGTAFSGGASNFGTVFSLTTNGTGFTNLHNFTGGADGSSPYCSLLLVGNSLYGTTLEGGSLSNGVVFKLATNGTGFTTLHAFAGGSEGVRPYNGLVLLTNTLFGATANGGGNGNGTIFSIGTDGTAFKNLYSFSALSSTSNGTNADGAYPYGSLIAAGNALYGTAYAGGDFSAGTIFKINANGSNFITLHSLATNEGAKPLAGLMLASNLLYGTTAYGGAQNNGTIFKISTNGTGFATLYNFGAVTPPITGTNSDGANPSSSLILSSNVLLGTAFYGGSFGSGTVFSLDITPPIPLQIALQTNQIVLFWPAAATNYVLQTVTNILSTNWITLNNNGPGRIVVSNNLKMAYFRLAPK